MTRVIKRGITGERPSDPPTPTAAIVPSPRATTVREALIAEAIGDVGRLLDRIDPLLVSMEQARKAIADAKSDLGGGLKEFQMQVGAFTERAKSNIVQHVVSRSNEVAAQSVEAQTQAMRRAARQLFDDEVGPTLRRLTEALRQIVERTLRPWEGWMTHLATAVTSAVVTWGLIFFRFR